MKIKEAKFVISSASVDKAPDTNLHEYAFIGRSNVGKSSLINMLTGRSGLAMTSAKPGKTMLINHFLVNDSWYIVDLPGYGYAQRSKTDLAKIDKMIRDYILYRPQMTNLFLLIDSRHKPQKIDLEFMEWLAENEVPFSIVFTKLDKLGKVAGSRNVADYCEKLLEQWEELPPIFLTSSEDGRGREELLDYIEKLNKLPLEGSEPSDDTVVDNEKENTKEEDMDKEKKSQEIKAVDNLPGAAIDAADDERATAQNVADDVKELNNIPNID